MSAGLLNRHSSVSVLTYDQARSLEMVQEIQSRDWKAVYVQPAAAVTVIFRLLQFALCKVK